MSAKQFHMVGIAMSVAVLGVMAQAQRAPLLLRDDSQSRTRDTRMTRARVEPGLYLGDLILTISGSGSSDRKFDANVASAELGLGLFIADNIALALRQGISYADTGSSSDWNGSSRLGLDFFLDLGILKPFVGAGLGYIYGDGVRSQFIAGPNTGVLVFLNYTTFINLGMEYQFLFKDADEARDVYDDGRFVYSLGMGVKW